MNEFGEPNMGNPSVRFDEGRERVGHWPLACQSNRFCLLYSAKPERFEDAGNGSYRHRMGERPRVALAIPITLLFAFFACFC